MLVIYLVLFAVLHSGFEVFVKTEEDAEVIILGAGIAGLTAAKTLAEKNVTNFIILEGSNRIGGRIKNEKINSNTVEIGNNYIVGTKGNPIWVLAEKNNLSGLVTNYENITILDEQGTNIKDTTASKAYDEWEKAQTTVDAKYSDINGEKTKDMSFSVALRLGGWNADTAVKQATEWNENTGFTFSERADLLSLRASKAFLENIKSDGSDDEFLVSDQKGFSHIFDEFLNKSDSRLKLNEVVTKIKYSNSGVTITTKANNTYHAKYAIVTFGIGVLQNKLVEFDPQLPSWKKESLFRINVGHAANVYLKCSEEARKFISDVEYALYVNENFGYYPLWINMVSDRLLPSSSGIISIALTGEQARRVERLEKSKVKSEITAILRKLNDNDTISEPTDVLVSDWSKNPLFMGSVTNLPVGYSQDFMNALKAPTGRLYYAGDGYNEVYNGFMQGAYYSGREQAEAVLKCRQGSCTKYEPPKPPTCPVNEASQLRLSAVFSLVLCFVTTFINVYFPS